VERRRLDGDLHALIPPWERLGFLAAFTERTGGASEGPYRSLNLGLRTDDDPERVGRNWALLSEALGIPPIRTARQVHGVAAVRVDRSAGFEAPVAEADILEATEPGVAVAVLTADCLPILLASELESRLVAVHAGWRGLAGGIVDRAASLFAAPEEVTAALGPAIGPCHYPVGREVADAVAGATPAVVQTLEGTLRLDLAATAVAALKAAGIRTLDVAGVCTACQRDRFFSHRRDGRTGRQALIATRL
jgi:polyphenol oxidase